MWGSSSSTAVSPPPTSYDVFLSFRGLDTRGGITSHLREELCRKNIKTYMDDRLVRGEEISPALHKAIEESMIYVIIFSENYASSKWCLDELKKILECNKIYGRVVIPVFYKVDPSTIRHRRGSYAEAFVKHEQRYKDEVQGWKAALTKAADTSGWNSQETRPESKLVSEIVKDILRKLDHSSLSDYQGLIGIHKHIAQIESLLHVESAAVRIIGIWGMGGIGKTTIADAIYHKLKTQFSSSCFVVDVQDEIERNGIYHVYDKCLSKILGEDLGPYGRLSSNPRLAGAKVLLILDNVNNSGQLKDLIGGHGSFGLGSRIILTSRDKQVLKNAEADEIYEVKEMNFQDSLQLFSLNAFKQNYPVETYMSLSEKVLNYAKGIPLALKVLGSLLYSRTSEEWESELRKLEKLLDLEIFNVLKLSYDGLDGEQKDIFLDIACFYRGHDENTVKQTLDSCDFSAAIGMRVLIDRGLVSILNGKIVMHDLIQEMGQEIVRQQSVNEPGKRSRLWKHEDIYLVLRKNKGTDAIQCIFLDICKIRKVKLHADTFKMMHNLRLLQFYKSNLWESSKVCIPPFLQSLPDDLRFLRWDGFPQKSFPSDFYPENLVKLDMRDSHLEQLWETDQHLPNLKRLDLSFSKNLIRIPDLSQSPNIEEIILNHCMKLDEVYSSSFLSKLNCLELCGCVGLRRLELPSNILSRSSGLIVLYNCYNLETFSVNNITRGVLSYGFSRPPPRPFFIANAQCATGARIDEEPGDDIHSLSLEVLRQGLPSLFPSFYELGWLDLSNCESLTSLPTDLCKMKFLRRLYLCGCSNLENLPEIEETMENLMVLILARTAIQKLPSSMDNLVGLEELSLHMCQRLELIPSSIGSLGKLRKLDLTYCESLESLPSSIFELKLTTLDLHGCSFLRTFPEILKPAESFVHLRLTKTAIKDIPSSSLKHLVGLRTLHLNLCRDLELFPNSIFNVNHLSVLDCSGCEKLKEIPSDIGRLSSLRELSLHGSGIVNLPDSIARLSSLKSLDLSDCEKLECIPELPPFLKQLFAFDCPSIRRVMSSSRFILPSDSKEGIFKFRLTNSQQLDPSAHSNIAADARRRMLEDAYRTVFSCFAGSGVPHWFPYRCEGHSVTFSEDSLNRCNDNNFIGFALCVVLGVREGTHFRCAFSYIIKIEYDDGTHTICGEDELGICFYWKGRYRELVQDHTFQWKYHLKSAGIFSNAHSITFEISNYYDDCNPTVKECGICPLYTNEKDDNADDTGDYSNFKRFSNNDNEEAGGSSRLSLEIRKKQKKKLGHGHSWVLSSGFFLASADRMWPNMVACTALEAVRFQQVYNPGTLAPI